MDGHTLALLVGALVLGVLAGMFYLDMGSRWWDDGQE
jgi:hypothetical protein